MPAHFLDLFGVPGSLLDGRPQVQLALGVDVPVGPVAEAHGVLLAGAEGRPRELDLADAAGQLGDQRRVELFALGHGFDVVGQLEEGIQGNDALRIQDALQVLRDMLAGVGVFRGRRSRQQLDQPFLRLGGKSRGAAASRARTAAAAGIEQIALIAKLREGAGNRSEHSIGLGVWYSALAHQDLPQTDQRLEGSQRIGAPQLVVDLADRLGGVQEVQDGGVAEAARFAEDGVLGCRSCDTRAPAGPRWPAASGVARLRSTSLMAMKIFSGSFSTALRHRAKRASSTSSGSFQVVARRVSLPSYLPCGWLDEQVLPHVQAAGDVRLAIGIQAQARGEQHHVGVRPEDRAGRTGAGDAAAHGGVEALHAGGLGEVLRDRAVNARQGVVEAGQPAIVLADELVEELGALVRRSAGQLGPGRRRALAARNHGHAVADLEHAAEEIQHVGVGAQAGVR